MKFYSLSLICFIIICLCFQLKAQPLFSEHSEWGKVETEFIPKHVSLSHTPVPDSLAKGDTLLIKFLYPNQQVAIEGI